MQPFPSFYVSVTLGWFQVPCQPPWVEGADPSPGLQTIPLHIDPSHWAAGSCRVQGRDEGGCRTRTPRKLQCHCVQASCSPSHHPPRTQPSACPVLPAIPAMCPAKGQVISDPHSQAHSPLWEAPGSQQAGSGVSSWARILVIRLGYTLCALVSPLEGWCEGRRGGDCFALTKQVSEAPASAVTALWGLATGAQCPLCHCSSSYSGVLNSG